MIVTFMMFFFRQTEYIISCYFSISAISFVGRVCISIFACCAGMFVVSNECVVLGKACMQQTCDESALSVQQNDVEKEMKYEEQFRSRYSMVLDCNIKDVRAKIF